MTRYQSIMKNVGLHPRPILHKRLTPPVVKTHDNMYQTGGSMEKFIFNKNRSSIASIFSADLAFDSELEQKLADAYGGFEEFPYIGPQFGNIGVIPKYENFLYCLFARENWWERSSYRVLRECINKMRDHAVSNKVKSICVPRLGTLHNEGLSWFEVVEILNNAFKGTKVDIVAYSLGHTHYGVYDRRANFDKDSVIDEYNDIE